MLLNFSASQAKGLFWLRLAYFAFLSGVFSLCRRCRLEKILAPISGGIALIFFIYGILQKYLIFPAILRQLEPGPSFYAHALHARVAFGRIFAVFPLPTLYAMVCGLLLIFVVHYLYRSRGRAQFFWGGLFLLGAFNLVLTQSFGGILFFTVGILFYLFASRRFRARHLAPLLMVLTLVFFLVTALRFSDAREMTPAKLRFANWAQAGRLIIQAPLLGVGLGNYESAVSPHIRANEPTSIYAHNFFLQFAAEAGLPLFLLLAIMTLHWLKSNLPRFADRENALFASACVLILCFNMFDIGNFFFAAGISFSLVLSQVVRLPGPVRPRHVSSLLLPAIVLLVHAAAASRQQAGDLWLSRGKPQRAESSYRSALKIEPFSYRAWLGLAHIAWERGDGPAAEKCLDRVFGAFPGQAYAHYLVSHIAVRRGAYLTALAHACRAAEANRKNNEYQRWHDFIKGAIAQRTALPGN